MEYIVENSRYVFSYSDLKEDYLRFKEMSDDAFLAALIPILHFSCFVCYFKDIPNHAVLSDKGLIHELVHLLDYDTRPDALIELPEIRRMFNKICELV